MLRLVCLPICLSVCLSVLKRPAALISIVKSGSYSRQGDRMILWELLQLVLVLVFKITWFFCLMTDVSNQLL